MQFLAVGALRWLVLRRNVKRSAGPMSNGKDHKFRPPLYHGEQNGKATRKGSQSDGDSAPSEQQGWEAYRKWLSRVSMQPARRTARDASIYSWRGYNNWADKIRQNWESEDS